MDASVVHRELSTRRDALVGHKHERRHHRALAHRHLPARVFGGTSASETAKPRNSERTSSDWIKPPSHRARAPRCHNAETQAAVAMIPDIGKQLEACLDAHQFEVGSTRVVYEAPGTAPAARVDCGRKRQIAVGTAAAKHLHDR